MSAIENSSDAYLGSPGVGTIFVGIGGDAALVMGAHIQWDAVYAGTITVESSNFPDVALNSTTAGEWIDESSITDVVVAGGAAGGAMLHIGNNGARRLRLRIATGTNGRLRVRNHGKV